MRPSLALVIAPAIIATTFIAAHRDATRLRGATLDFADDPVSVAVDADGDVLVGLRTDVMSGVVRRFSASGVLRSATAWSGALEPRPFVAEGPAGTTFVAQSMADEIAVIDAAGIVGKRWAVPFPTERFSYGGIVASNVLSQPVTVTVFALVEAAGGRSAVGFAADGREISRWSAEGSAYDLAVGLAADGELRVYVVVHGRLGGTSRVMAHRLDGTVADEEDVEGDIVGFDTARDGVPIRIVRPELSPTAHLNARTGPPIAGNPRDLAVAPNGDLFVVSHMDDLQSGVVLHYTAAGCLIATWPNLLLAGARGIAPTPGPSPCPQMGRTPTPDEPPPTGTWVSSPTADLPQTVTPAPSDRPTPPPTPTRTPTVIIDWLPAYLPIARRDAVRGP